MCVQNMYVSLFPFTGNTAYTYIHTHTLSGHRGCLTNDPQPNKQTYWHPSTKCFSTSLSMWSLANVILIRTTFNLTMKLCSGLLADRLAHLTHWPHTSLLIVAVLTAANLRPSLISLEQVIGMLAVVWPASILLSLRLLCFASPFLAIGDHCGWAANHFPPNNVWHNPSPSVFRYNCISNTCSLLSNWGASLIELHTVQDYCFEHAPFT